MKSIDATLTALPNGTVQGLYTEVIDLGALGRLNIQRLTTVEFDHPTQLWRVLDRKGQCLYASPSRSQCLRWEQVQLAGAGLNHPAS